MKGVNHSISFMNPSTCTFKSAHIRGVFDFIQLLYLSLSIYICIYEYIYIYICICTNSYLYPRGVWCVVHGYLRADSGRAIRDAATSAAHERMMGRAGRAWAPFLETLAEYEKAYHGPQFTGICVKHRGVRFRRTRDFKQYYFNSIPPTSHSSPPGPERQLRSVCALGRAVASVPLP